MESLFALAEPELLPAISMWQPYASLVFETDPAFRKAHETRSFRYPPKYDGQRVAIQAAATFPTRNRLVRLIGLDRERSLHNQAARAFGSDYRRTLPFGAYLGTVVLGGCWPTETLRREVSHADIAAGVWDDGRFGWRFDAPQRLAEPIPAKGKQGWWSVRADTFALPTSTTPEVLRNTRHGEQVTDG